MWVKDTRTTRVSQTVYFRHTHTTQPVVTHLDAILRAADDLISVLKGKQVIKGATRSAIDLLVDILRGYEGEPTKIEDQRAQMEKAAEAKAQSEKEESEAQDVYTKENEPSLGDDDLRSTKLINITHPPPDGPRGIEDDVPNFRITRSSKRAALLTAVEICGSCPSPQQTSGRQYLLTFMFLLGLF